MRREIAGCGKASRQLFIASDAANMDVVGLLAIFRKVDGSLQGAVPLLCGAHMLHLDRFGSFCHLESGGDEAPSLFRQCVAGCSAGPLKECLLEILKKKFYLSIVM